MDNSPLIVLAVCALAVIPFAAFVILRHWRGPQDVRVPEALWLPPDETGIASANLSAASSQNPAPAVQVSQALSLAQSNDRSAISNGAPHPSSVVNSSTVGTGHVSGHN